MAINFTTPNSFTPNTVILSAQVNANFQNVETVFDGIEAGTTTFSQIKMDANPSAALNVATKQYVDNYAAWRRPNLTWISVTQVDVQNNTGTANQTSILFPDGELRSVVENTSSTNVYRRFDITATANFTSGTEDSGLYSGLSEGANWYAIYAVKSQINSANFVLVGTTTLPLQANYSTLNSNFGTSSWVYLGMIANSNGNAATGDIVKFYQTGNFTTFANTSNLINNVYGVRLANATAGSASLTYTYSSGTAIGSGNIPGNVTIGNIALSVGGTGSNTLQIQDAGGNFAFALIPTSSVATFQPVNNVPLVLGFAFSLNLGSTSTWHMLLTGFYDNVLGVGSNPLL